MDVKRNVIYTEQTRFGTIRVTDQQYAGRPARYLTVDGWSESAIYLDPKESDIPIFPYMKTMTLFLKLRPGAQNIFLTGGGAFAWPRDVLPKHPEMSMTVAEYYPEIVRTAREFFGLDELEARYGSRLSVRCGDGFSVLDSENASYDFIANDAFTGNKSAGRTLTDIRLAKRHLKRNGIYMVNVVSASWGFLSFPVKHFLYLLGKEFGYTDYFVCERDRDPAEPQNFIAAGSDAPLTIL